MLIGLPLIGVALAGKPLAPYLQFPPDTTFVVHAPFSWWVFSALTGAVVACMTPFVYRVIHAARQVRNPPIAARAFPWWGWLGVAIVAFAWWIAWNRFPWLKSVQEFTFSPLWFGYILVINAMTWRRTGHCMLRDRTGYFVALFPLSAGFWWFFEYLNRFVQNWYYVGISDFTPWQYFWHATLPFSTVLPAVLGTREWLASYPAVHDGLKQAWRIEQLRTKLVGWTTLFIAGAGLTAIGVWPDHFYSLVWVAPLLIITALQTVIGEESILDPVTRGDWRVMWQAALAALICGFFWELWNYNSLAHWEYSIPFVHRFEIFHMPLLGYAGYLPFGLECLAVASLLDRIWRRNTVTRAL